VHKARLEVLALVDVQLSWYSEVAEEVGTRVSTTIDALAIWYNSP
jgi:hypothetical protein